MRLDRLTSLRFFAAMLVVGVHLSYCLRDSWLTPVLRHGGTGVGFFFILSGFVLAWSHRDGDTATAFYRRRFARVYPLHALMWVVLVTLGAAGLTTYAGLVTDLPALVLLQVWFARATVYFGANGVSWTLGCEAFFYALFPFLLTRLKRLSIRRLQYLAFACFTGIAVVGAAVDPRTDHGAWLLTIFPPIRVLEFVIGVCLALLMRLGWRLPIAEPLALTLAVISLAATNLAPSGLSAVFVTAPPFAALIAASAAADLDGLPGWLRHPRLVTLGVWSFALYLCHQAIFNAVLANVDDAGVRQVMGLLAVPVAIALSGCLHVAVERPAERRLRGVPVGRRGPGRVTP